MPVSPGEVYLPTNAYVPGLGDTSELNLTPAMTSILTIQSGPAAGKDFTLHRFPICIGRGPDAGVRLDEDRSVSRRHAEIYEKAGRLHIRDLDSTHGTQVNGNWTSDQPLEPGDEIQLGSSTLLFQQQEA
jgi:pSer/pThr/pTyr-binding forkhead associated (FHA) protein